MIVEYVRYEVDEGSAAAFCDAYAKAVAILQADARCLGYEVSQGVEEPRHFVVRSKWTSLDDHRDGFRRGAAYVEFEQLIAPFDYAIREIQHFAPRTRAPDLPEKGVPSLYEWCGGKPALSALITAFYDRVERDPLLRGLFPGGASEPFRARVTAWWTEVFGGPADYTPIGGYTRMVAHHLGLQISSEQRLRYAVLMSLAADDARLPADPEFRAAFVAYVEWATRLAMHNSQPDAHVVREAPMPRWGWGVVPPYRGSVGSG